MLVWVLFLIASCPFDFLTFGFSQWLGRWVRDTCLQLGMGLSIANLYWPSVVYWQVYTVWALHSPFLGLCWLLFSLWWQNSWPQPKVNVVVLAHDLRVQPSCFTVLLPCLSSVVDCTHNHSKYLPSEVPTYSKNTQTSTCICSCPESQLSSDRAVFGQSEYTLLSHGLSSCPPSQRTVGGIVSVTTGLASWMTCQHSWACAF